MQHACALRVPGGVLVEEVVTLQLCDRPNEPAVAHDDDGWPVKESIVNGRDANDEQQCNNNVPDSRWFVTDIGC